MSKLYSQAKKEAIARYREKNPQKVKEWVNKSNCSRSEKLQDDKEYYKAYIQQGLINKYDTISCVRYLFTPFKIRKNMKQISLKN